MKCSHKIYLELLEKQKFKCENCGQRSPRAILLPIIPNPYQTLWSMTDDREHEITTDDFKIWCVCCIKDYSLEYIYHACVDDLNFRQPEEYIRYLEKIIKRQNHE